MTAVRTPDRQQLEGTRAAAADPRGPRRPGKGEGRGGEGREGRGGEGRGGEGRG